MPADKVVTLITGHCWQSKRKAGFHWLTDAFWRHQWKVNFVIAWLSPIEWIKRDYRVQYIRRLGANKPFAEKERLTSFITYLMLRPPSRLGKLGDWLTYPLLAVEDASSQIHAAAFLVTDAQTTYYLICGGDPALRSSGAGNLAIWEAIKHAGSTGTMFDFEGSMNRNIGRYIKSFGAAEEATITVRKCSRRLFLLTAFKDVLGASTGTTLPWFF